MEQFEVVFYDDDRKTILYRTIVNKGESVTYGGSKTEKGGKYVLVGWEGEENMACVERNLTLYAKYEPIIADERDAYYDATVKSTENVPLSGTIDAGTRLTEHEMALSRDSRSPEEIVREVLENGSAVIGEDRSQGNDTEIIVDDDFEK